MKRQVYGIVPGTGKPGWYYRDEGPAQARPGRGRITGSVAGVGQKRPSGGGGPS